MFLEVSPVTVTIKQLVALSAVAAAVHVDTGAASVHSVLVTTPTRLVVPLSFLIAPCKIQA
jgi:hypothetical protein